MWGSTDAYSSAAFCADRKCPDGRGVGSSMKTLDTGWPFGHSAIWLSSLICNWIVCGLWSQIDCKVLLTKKTHSHWPGTCIYPYCSASNRKAAQKLRYYNILLRALGFLLFISLTGMISIQIIFCNDYMLVKHKCLVYYNTYKYEVFIRPQLRKFIAKVDWLR